MSMNHHRSQSAGSVLSPREPQRIAVIGGGLGGLTCARELQLRGHRPVVFEASDRVGGRCSSHSSPIGWFDDAAQAISGHTRLASYATQQPGELAVLHPWTVAATAAEDEPTGRDRDKEMNEELSSRTLKPMGDVGVPSMSALAQAISQPLVVRLRTTIQQAQRNDDRWVLRDAAGKLHNNFQALVLAIPAPQALPLAQASPGLTAALGAVRYANRWVLMLGCERPVGLPAYRAFESGPIEVVAAMHSKPGRPAGGPQRWVVQASERWSLQHEHDDADTVAELLLDLFRAHAGRGVTPIFIHAQPWRYAFVKTPANAPGYSECLWDDEVRLGVCGDSVVASQLDLVHRSGVALAALMADSLSWQPMHHTGPSQHAPSMSQAQIREPRKTWETQTAHS
jgi:renalase